MKSARSLDFSLLQAPVAMEIFINLPDDIEHRFVSDAVWEEVHDRARASLRFMVKGDSDQKWNVEARLRAGLNEFYSLEDAANRVYRTRSAGAKAPRISDSRHPLVHAMYALRHVNVHVRPSSTRQEKVQVVYQHPNEPYQFAMDAVMIERDTIDAVLATAEVRKYYAGGEMKTALSWLLDSQQVFGVGQVLRQGLEQYCREVLAQA